MTPSPLPDCTHDVLYRTIEGDAWQCEACKAILDFALAAPEAVPVSLLTWLRSRADQCERDASLDASGAFNEAADAIERGDLVRLTTSVTIEDLRAACRDYCNTATAGELLLTALLHRIDRTNALCALAARHTRGTAALPGEPT